MQWSNLVDALIWVAHPPRGILGIADETKLATSHDQKAQSIKPDVKKRSLIAVALTVYTTQKVRPSPSQIVTNQLQAVVSSIVHSYYCRNTDMFTFPE